MDSIITLNENKIEALTHIESFLKDSNIYYEKKCNNKKIEIISFNVGNEQIKKLKSKIIEKTNTLYWMANSLIGDCVLWNNYPDRRNEYLNNEIIKKKKVLDDWQLAIDTLIDEFNLNIRKSCHTSMFGMDMVNSYYPKFKNRWDKRIDEFFKKIGNSILTICNKN